MYSTSNILEFITCCENGLGTTKILKAFLFHVDYHNGLMAHEWCLGPSVPSDLEHLKSTLYLLTMALFSLLTIHFSVNSQLKVVLALISES